MCNEYRIQSNTSPEPPANCGRSPFTSTADGSVPQKTKPTQPAEKKGNGKSTLLRAGVFSQGLEHPASGGTAIAGTK